MTVARVSVSDQQATSSARRLRDERRVRDIRMEEADLRQATAPRSKPATAVVRRAREAGVPVTTVSTKRKTVNTPVMSGYERTVRSWADAGNDVLYSSTPIYERSNPMPVGVALSAESSAGHMLNVIIPNQK